MPGIVEYLDLRGNNAFERWFLTLDDWSFSSAAAARSASKKILLPLKTYGAITRRGNENRMPLTKSFNDTVKARLEQSGAFRRELLREAVNAMLAGDLDTGKSILRRYINGTVGFISLGQQLDRSPKVLMHMLGPTGNPQARNLLALMAHLQKLEGLTLEAVEHAA